MAHRLLVRDLAQLATPAPSAVPARGSDLEAVDVLERAYVLCADGVIESVGRMRDLGPLGGDVEEIEVTVDGEAIASEPDTEVPAPTPPRKRTAKKAPTERAPSPSKGTAAAKKTAAKKSTAAKVAAKKVAAKKAPAKRAAAKESATAKKAPGTGRVRGES